MRKLYNIQTNSNDIADIINDIPYSVYARVSWADNSIQGISDRFYKMYHNKKGVYINLNGHRHYLVRHVPGCDRLEPQPLYITRTWRVYGAYGHAQRESFYPSAYRDFTDEDVIRNIYIANFDKTGTHDYTEITITRNTAEECLEELNAQLSDGIFENSRIGDVVEI